MQLFILHFDSNAGLSRAFQLLLESSDVVSCVVESEHGRIRFHAPAPPAEKLLEEIYLHGELRWCSRHALAG
jgi:hypothetical protein